MDRNNFIWRLIHITLGFFIAIAQVGNIFSTDAKFDEYMALQKYYFTQLDDNLGEIFFVLYHFLVGLYEHVCVQQIYAVEMQALCENLLLGTPSQLITDADPTLDAIHYHYDIFTTSCPESSGEEGDLGDRNNDSNKIDN